MSAAFAIGLVLFTLAVAVMRLRYGRHWWRLPFGVLVIAACVYHPISEIAIRATGAGAVSIDRPPEVWIDRGLIVTGTALVAAVLGYSLGNKRGVVASNVNLLRLAHAFDWRIFAVLTVPLFGATVTGQGYINAEALQGEGIGLRGLSVQLFVPMVIASAFAFLLKRPRSLPAVLLVQSAVLAVAGQRLELLLGGVVLLLLAGRIGLSLSLRQWVYAAAVGGIFMVAITGVRADQGREIFYSDTGLVARFEALGRGLGDPRLSAGPQGTGSVVGEAALRLDSNSWTGNVAMALDGSGGTTTGVAVVLGSVLAMVPSVIYTGKLAVDVYQRDPESAAIVYLGLPPSDYLPGHLTILYGALTWPQLLLVMLGVGLVLGNVESRVCGNSGPFAMLGYMLLLIAAVFYERGLVSGYLSAGRSFVIMAGVLGLTNWAGRNRSTLKGLHAARQPVQSARHGSGTHG